MVIFRNKQLYLHQSSKPLSELIHTRVFGSFSLTFTGALSSNPLLHNAHTVLVLITVNPRITPQGLIYQQRYFGWGLIRAGGLFEQGAY